MLTKDSGCIETCKGRLFYFDAPVFDHEEIAHAQSHLCRYTGHTRRFYSVAEHSVLVSNIMGVLDLGNPFEGLMHDTTEAYMNDMASPLKARLPDYKAIEQRLDKWMRRQYGLPESGTDGCRHADWIALYLEAQQLIPSGGEDWHFPDAVVRDAELYCISYTTPRLGLQPDRAKELWLNTHLGLTP